MEYNDQNFTERSVLCIKIDSFEKSSLSNLVVCMPDMGPLNLNGLNRIKYE